ncbi:MAG: M24 family metallopeptidase, partial [Anaerolineae bacterium]
MHLKRLERVLSLAQAQGLDALAVMPGPNLFYLTGLSFGVSERPIIGFFPVDLSPGIVLPVLETGKISEVTAFPYGDEEGYALAFHQACATLELADARIGIEVQRMRVLEARILRRYASGSDLVPADALLARPRMLKDLGELDAMRRAVAVAEEAFEAWLGQLRLGMTEKESAARLVAALLTGGAERIAFEPIVAGGPNGALPHAVPGNRTFEAGDWVVVDWGAVVDGYASDITRAVVFGEPEGVLAEVHAI